MSLQSNESRLPTPATALSIGEVVQARGYSYALCSRLFLHGLTPALAPAVAAIPELAVTCPADIDPDQAAADHQALLGFALFPYQSIFLDPSGLLGGEESVRVQHSYTHYGFVPVTSTEAPDHIGHELACLAFLCAAESDAWEDQRTGIVQQVQRLQVDFLQNHLLRWLPPLVLAMQRQHQPFYAALAELTLALVDHHLTEMHDRRVHGTVATATFTLSPAPMLLEERTTTLADIVNWLLAPPYSGLFLSRDDLGRLARRYQLPRGFGERALLLTNLLRSAIKYDCFGALITDLHTLVNTEAQAYQRFADEMPASTPWLARWQAQTTATAALLLRINTLAADELTRLQGEDGGFEDGSVQMV